jgi:GTP cyclohydrolase I
MIKVKKDSLKRPSQKQAEDAVRTLISWLGDNPDREGLIETPKRVVNSYKDFFSGYGIDPLKVLGKTFEEFENYDDMILLKNMRMESHCEHHMVPFLGTAHIAYWPNHKIVGISKIARLLDVFAKRLQTQEMLTSQIADAINIALKPKGVAVLIDAEHQCMTTRGIHKVGTSTITKKMVGIFKDDLQMEMQFLKMISFHS